MTAMSQVTKIMGHVKDAKTGEAIPFANIVLKGTTLGTLTDFNGNYALEFKVQADSLRASLLGYFNVDKEDQYCTISRPLTSNSNLSIIIYRRWWCDIKEIRRISFSGK